MTVIVNAIMNIALANLVNTISTDLIAGTTMTIAFTNLVHIIVLILLPFLLVLFPSL